MIKNIIRLSVYLFLIMFLSMSHDLYSMRSIGKVLQQVPKGQVPKQVPKGPVTRTQLPYESIERKGEGIQLPGQHSTGIIGSLRQIKPAATGQPGTHIPEISVPTMPSGFPQRLDKEALARQSRKSLNEPLAVPIKPNEFEKNLALLQEQLPKYELLYKEAEEILSLMLVQQENYRYLLSKIQQKDFETMEEMESAANAFKELKQQVAKAKEKKILELREKLAQKKAEKELLDAQAREAEEIQKKAQEEVGALGEKQENLLGQKEATEKEIEVLKEQENPAQKKIEALTEQQQKISQKIETTTEAANKAQEKLVQAQEANKQVAQRLEKLGKELQPLGAKKISEAHEETLSKKPTAESSEKKTTVAEKPEFHLEAEQQRQAIQDAAELARFKAQQDAELKKIEEKNKADLARKDAQRRAELEQLEKDRSIELKARQEEQIKNRQKDVAEKKAELEQFKAQQDAELKVEQERLAKENVQRLEKLEADEAAREAALQEAAQKEEAELTRFKAEQDAQLKEIEEKNKAGLAQKDAQRRAELEQLEKDRSIELKARQEEQIKNRQKDVVERKAELEQFKAQQNAELKVEQERLAKENAQRLEKLEADEAMRKTALQEAAQKDAAELARFKAQQDVLAKAEKDHLAELAKAKEEEFAQAREQERRAAEEAAKKEKPPVKEKMEAGGSDGSLPIEVEKKERPVIPQPEIPIIPSPEIPRIPQPPILPEFPQKEPIIAEEILQPEEETPIITPEQAKKSEEKEPSAKHAVTRDYTKHIRPPAKAQQKEIVGYTPPTDDPFTLMKVPQTPLVGEVPKPYFQPQLPRGEWIKPIRPSRRGSIPSSGYSYEQPIYEQYIPQPVGKPEVEQVRVRQSKQQQLPREILEVLKTRAIIPLAARRGIRPSMRGYFEGMRRLAKAKEAQAVVPEKMPKAVILQEKVNPVVAFIQNAATIIENAFNQAIEAINNYINQ